MATGDAVFTLGTLISSPASVSDTLMANEHNAGVNESGGATLTGKINDLSVGTDDTTYVKNVIDQGYSIEFYFDAPEDFVSWSDGATQTATLEIRGRWVNFNNDDINSRAMIVRESDSKTLIFSSYGFFSVSNTTFTSVNVTSVNSGDVSVVGSQKIRLRMWFDVQVSMGSDGCEIQISGASLTLHNATLQDPAIEVNPGTGAAEVTGHAPTAAVLNSNVDTFTGAVEFTGLAPFALGDILVPTGSAAITGYAPTVGIGILTFPGVGAMALTGYAPDAALIRTIPEDPKLTISTNIDNTQESSDRPGIYYGRFWFPSEPVNDFWTFIKDGYDHNSTYGKRYDMVPVVDGASPGYDANNALYPLTTFWNTSSVLHGDEGWLLTETGYNGAYVLRSYAEDSNTYRFDCDLFFDSATRWGFDGVSGSSSVSRDQRPPHWAYVRNENPGYTGWVFGYMDDGGSDVPAVYTATNGGGWDTGTVMIPESFWGPTGQNRVQSSMKWWCRASETNPDQIYVCYAITNFVAERIIIAVDLTNIAGASIIYHFPNEANYADFGHHNAPCNTYAGTMEAFDPCTPMTYDGSPKYMIQDGTDTSNYEMVEVILNAGDWLTPTINHHPLPWRTDNPILYNSSPAGSYLTTKLPYLYYDATYDRFWAFDFAVASSDNTADDTEIWFYYIELSATPASWAASSWQLIDKDIPAHPDPVESGAKEWLVKSWPTVGMHNRGGTRVPISFIYTFWNTLYAGGGPYQRFVQIEPFELYGKYKIDQSIAMDLTPDVSIGAGVEYSMSQTLDLKGNMSVTLTTEVVEGLGIPIFYSLEGSGSVVDATLTMNLTPTITLSTDENSKAITPTVDLGGHVSITLTTDEITTLRTKYLNNNAIYFGTQWASDFRDRVNAVRSAAGKPLMSEITIQRLDEKQPVWYRGIMLKYAEMMAENDTTAETHAGYDDEIDTALERAETTNAIWYGELPEVFALINGDEGGRIISDGTLPSPDYLFDTLGWETTYQSFWNYDYSEGGTELYMQIGIAFGFSSDFPSDQQAVYIGMQGLDYTGVPTGDPGGGVTIEPTDTTGPRDFQSNYVLTGQTWHEELLALVNELRANYGLAAYKLPDLAFYQKYPTDIAWKHADNMRITQVLAHESTDFPAGYQTLAERAARAGFDFMNENAALWPASPYINPDDDTDIVGDKEVWSDVTHPTPQEAFEGWYNSYVHRKNLLRSWGTTEVYSLLGWAAEEYPPNTLIEDQYHGQAFFVSGYWIWLNNNFADASLTVATRYFNTNYEQHGALIEILNVEYDLLTWVDVKADHSTSYSIRMTVAHEASYGARAAKVHEAPLFYSVMRAHTAPYVGSLPVANDHISSYRIRDTVDAAKDHSAVYGYRLSKDHIASYEPNPQARRDHHAAYEPLPQVARAHEGRYEPMIEVAKAHNGFYEDAPSAAAAHESSYDIRTAVAQEHEGMYHFLDPVAADHSGVYELSATEPARRAHTSFYSLLGEAVFDSSPTTTLTVNGVNYEVLDYVLSQDEDDPAWVARVRVAGVEEYQNLPVGQTATLTVGVDPWSLVVTERAIDRTFGTSPDFKIKLESPVVQLMSPIAEQMSYTNDTAVWASDLAETVLGETITWSIIDWMVPAEAYAVQNLEPYAAAALIVEAAGGILQAAPDGTLEARPYAPVPMNALSSVSPDVTLTDIEHNLSNSGVSVYRSGANRFRVTQGEAVFSDAMEFIPEEGDPTRGVLKVYPSPWRETFEIRSTDSATASSVQRISVTYETLIETVEFVDGAANLSKPIYALGSVNWLSDTLGAINFTQYSTSLSAGVSVNDGYGLAEVSFTVASIDYDVTGVFADTDQFVMEEDEG